MLITSTLLLCACTTISIESISPDGSKTSAHATSLWTNPVLSGFDAKVSGGERYIRLDKFSDEKTTGLESFNRMFPILAGQMVKSAIEGAK